MCHFGGVELICGAFVSSLHYEYPFWGMSHKTVHTKFGSVDDVL